MYQYANSFSCACPEDKSNFFINFNQLSPLFDENGDIEGTQSTTISSIVINTEGAATLIATLSSLLESNENNIDES